MDDIHLATAFEFEVDRIFDDGGLEFHHNGLNRQAVARWSLNDGHVTQPAERHIQRARNRRCGHGDDIDLFLEMLQTLFVSNAEALFLVDNHQTEILKLDVL